MGCVSAVSWEDVREGVVGTKINILFLGLRRSRQRRRAQRSRPWKWIRRVELYMSREQTIASLLVLQGLLTVSNCEFDWVAEMLYS